MGVLKVGQAGVGGRGRAILSSVLQSEKIDLTHICDVDEKAVEGALGKHGCTVCDTYDDMLASDVDAVLLILPNYLHEEFTVKAAAAGKHVFVEKPISNYLDEAGRMIDACKAHDVVLAVGHSARHRTQNMAIELLIKNGDLGDICGFYSCTSHDNAKKGDKLWKTDEKLAPCVPLMQLGVHIMDTFHAYFGDVESVFARHDNIDKRYDMVDTAQLMLRYKRGMTGSLASYYMVPKSKSLHVYGVGGRAMCVGNQIEVLREGASRPEYIDVSEDEQNPGDVRMLDAFVDAVLDDKPFPTEGVAGAKALAVVWAAIYSAELGREVTIDETLDHYGAGYLKG